MNSPVLWSLVAVQFALGAFDVLFHHELTERLAWRRSQRRELVLHGVRNAIYAVLFLGLGWLEPHGVWAMLVLLLLAAEVVVTLIDFVEEDLTRHLPASERVTHTLLALNYGAILVLLTPVLLAWAGEPSALVPAWYGFATVLVTFAAFAVAVFGLRDGFAARRMERLIPAAAAELVAALPSRQRVLVTGATGFIGRRLTEALAAAGHDVVVLARDPLKAAALRPPFRLVTSLDQVDSATAIDAIINLAGEPIANGLWTRRKRRRILASRLRITLVLGIDGGMLAQLLLPFEFGLGGPIGSGRQWMSWIERDDLIRLIAHAIATPRLTGPVNATAPTPVTNAVFAAELARALHRPSFLRLPAWLLRFVAGDLA